MKILKMILAGIFAFAILGFSTHKNEALPNFESSVTDFENLLTPQQERNIAQIIAAHEAKSDAKIAVITVSDFYDNDNIESFSNALAAHWKIGQKNGVLLVVSKYWSGVCIRYSSGVSEKLTNAETQNLINYTILPDFRSEYFYRGIKSGVQAIIAELEA